jgi:hypothetical protein
MNYHTPSFWLAVIGILCVLITFPPLGGFPYGLHLAVILIGLAVIFLGAPRP